MPPYQSLVVSMGAEGGMWVDEGHALLARVPEVKVVSTVGSGDAAFAGALYALSKDMQPAEALRLSMACGAANAVLGEVGSVRMEDVCAIEKEIKVTIIEK
jgi:fructose-1-phosphate kinase PfkB-like protein